MQHTQALPDCFRYTPGFIDIDQANALFEYLLQNTSWQHETLVMFGKTITTKRTSALYGDTGFSYSYAGQTKYTSQWTSELLEIKQLIESASGETFNVCLLNKYEDGLQGMGWHSDDEPELGEYPAIASLSLGAERHFDIKDKVSGGQHRITLENGSLLIMSGKSQSDFKHQLPISKKIKEPRINLTFRKIIK